MGIGLALWWFAACGSPTSPTVAVDEPAVVPAEAGVAQAAPARPAGDAGPAKVDASSLRALVDRVAVLLGGCGESVWRAAASPADADRVAAACDGLGVEADAAIAGEIGRSVEGDAFIAVLATAADDLKQLVRALRAPQHDGEVQSQIDHVAGATLALQHNIEKIRGLPELHPVVVNAGGCLTEAKAAELAPKVVDAWRGRFENLQKVLVSSAVLQSTLPELVRTRPLVANQKAARGRWEADNGRWGPACAREPGAQPWIERAQGALRDAGPVLDALDAAIQPFVAGEVHDMARGQQLQATFEAAAERWRGAWSAPTP